MEKEKKDGAEETHAKAKEQGTNMLGLMTEMEDPFLFVDDLKGMRSQYYRWMMRQTLINEHRTFWLLKEGNNNVTEPSSLPGYDTDIANVKSIIVYDSPHSYMSNEEIAQNFSVLDFRYVQNYDKDYLHPAGMYVVEIHLIPGRISRISLNKNTRQTIFAGYSPKVEFYTPEYPNGPIEGDVDYRRTIYWNPEVKTNRLGIVDVKFYNNSYSHSLTVSVEGMTDSGVAISQE